jgi:hypothetical protein
MQKSTLFTLVFSAFVSGGSEITLFSLSLMNENFFLPSSKVKYLKHVLNEVFK